MSEAFERAWDAIAKGGDFMAVKPESEDFGWLVEQLARWPHRVDQTATTNIRFLMQSAAATILTLTKNPPNPTQDKGA